MLMLGATLFAVIIYVPLFMQGVLGYSATRSGAVLIPLNFAWIAASTFAGRTASRTGHYRIFPVAGTPIALVGVWLISRLQPSSSALDIVIATAVVGVGMGLTIQTLVVALQNAVERSELGVATAANQFFRSVGGAIAVGAFGTLLVTRLRVGLDQRAIHGVSPEQLLESPGAASHFSPRIVDGVHAALSAALHWVFLGVLPLLAIAVAAVLLLRDIPLRTSSHVDVSAEPSAGA
jgi:MFS family permease